VAWETTSHADLATTRKSISRLVADQIVENLSTQILSGALPDGVQMPSERQLTTHYDVSAPTIREAIRICNCTFNSARRAVRKIGAAIGVASLTGCSPNR
jgi:hypothetical protein